MDNPFSVLQISPDDLRCLNNDEIGDLINRRFDRSKMFYEGDALEMEKVVSALKKLENINILKFYKAIMLKEIKDVSIRCLQGKTSVHSTRIIVNDIFYSMDDFNGFDEALIRKKMIVKYFIGKRGGLYVYKEGQCRRVRDKKFIGCIHYGSRAYSSFFQVLTRRSSEVKKGFYTIVHKWPKSIIRKREKIKIYNKNLAKYIPLGSFAFKLEYYVFDKLEEGAILLFADRKGNIMPAGKVVKFIQC